MTDQVTRLIVRADGALAVLDQFEQKMSDAGKATDRSTGSVANFEARMAKARAAMDAGNKIATETVARRSAEQRAYDSLAASVDKSYSLRIRLEREAERAAVSAANAVNMGYITQEQALSTLVALEQRHATQLGQAAAANDNLAASYRSSAAAADEAAAASMRANAARMRGAGGANTAHTTNLLFQAQDIAMMTAMGQAPMMLAMQQGMQVGGIFHQIGSGRQIVQALGGAIVGLLNPLNLATIATIALGAAGIQWFMSTMNSAEDATSALEKHDEMLDELLKGYGALRDNASEALASMQRLPEGVIASELLTSLEEQEALAQRAEERYAAFREEVAALASDLTALRDITTSPGESAGADLYLDQLRDLSELKVTAQMTATELEAVMVAAKRMHGASDDDGVKSLANDIYLAASEMRTFVAITSNLDSTLRNLPRVIQIRISMTQEFGNAFAELQGLYQDPRSRFDQMREQAKNAADQAMATATSYGQAVGAASEYERVLSSINAAEEAANAKSTARGAKAANKPFDQWKGNVDQFQQRIASQRMELELLGQSTYEVERQKAAFDLLNQAKQAGIPITSEVTDQINLMSAEYAAATVELQRQAEAQRQFDEQLNFYRGTFSGFFADMKSGLREGQGFWEAFGNAGANALDRIADRALSMAANGLFDLIFGAVMGGIGGGGGQWGVPGGFGRPGIFGIPSFAGGGDTGYGSRSGGLDGQGGFLAMLHPRETVTDHTRPSNRAPSNDNWPSVQIIDQRGRNVPAIRQERTKGANGEKQLRLIIRDEVQQAQHRGAVGF